jgi:hypothetical protein
LTRVDNSWNVQSFFFSEHLSPHVHGVATEQWPLDDVGPRQRVATKRATDFEEKCGYADQLGEEQAEVDSERILSNRRHISDFNRFYFSPSTTFFYMNLCELFRKSF